MSGNRKHGFLSGNRGGFKQSSLFPDWFCSGCNKEHKGKTSRNKMLDGLDYCDRHYYKLKEQELIA